MAARRHRTGFAVSKAFCQQAGPVQMKVIGNDPYRLLHTSDQRL